MRFNIRSVGLSPKSERQINEYDIEWANLILVMEQDQKTRIAKSYWHTELPNIQVLHIEDVYEYQDPELCEILADRINTTLELTYHL